MENIETGFMLMGIGMTTVFAILLLVIYLGKVLIVLVNKYAPEDIPQKKTKANPQPAMADAIPSSTLAAIISAIGTATQGKGNVVKIEKL